MEHGTAVWMEGVASWRESLWRGALIWMFLGVLFLAWHALDTKKALAEPTHLQGQAVFIQHAAKRD